MSRERDDEEHLFQRIAAASPPLGRQPRTPARAGGGPRGFEEGIIGGEESVCPPIPPAGYSTRGGASRQTVGVGSTRAPGGSRTPNLLIRSQTLYPLSYGRRGKHTQGRGCPHPVVAETARFERAREHDAQRPNPAERAPPPASLVVLPVRGVKDETTVPNRVSIRTLLRVLLANRVPDRLHGVGVTDLPVGPRGRCHSVGRARAPAAGGRWEPSLRYGPSSTRWGRGDEPAAAEGTPPPCARSPDRPEVERLVPYA